MEYIELFYETEPLLQNLHIYCRWIFSLYPNLLILGNTGSGKSYAIRIILARIGLRIKSAKIYLCDYKNELLGAAQLPPNSRYYGYKNVIDGFESFYSEFEARLAGNPDRRFSLLVIDEYVSWLNSFDRKDSDTIKRRMASLLFMCRSLNMHVLIGAQRGLAEHFCYGSRDCLNVILLGSPSRESVGSFLTSDEAVKIKPCSRGAGYVLFDGRPPLAITVPMIRNLENANALIIDAITR